MRTDCKICSHEDKRIIEAHIKANKPAQDIVDYFDGAFSRNVVRRHKDSHMGLHKDHPEMIPLHPMMRSLELAANIQDDVLFDLKKKITQLHISAVVSVEQIGNICKSLFDDQGNLIVNWKEAIFAFEKLNQVTNRTLETIQKSTALQVMTELSGETEKTVQFQIGEYQKKDKKDDSA